jgi:antitoxin component YwqK of YwqJK toxin-antitoxin module
LLSTAALNAQKTVGVNEIQFDPEKKLHCLIATQQPFTGKAYSVNYYALKDTTMLQGFTAGRMDYVKSFTNGKLYYAQEYYYGKQRKNDSICYVYYVLDQYTGDTTHYEYHWIDKQKVKRGRMYTYHYRYNGSPKAEYPIASVTNFRFFSRSETRDFTNYNYKQDSQYDSAGYHNTKELTGYYATYHTNGKLSMEGWNCVYESRLKNKGEYNYYDQYCGAWKYYTQEGVLTRVDEYVNGVAASSYYHANGKISTKSNYKKKGAELRLPSTQGIAIDQYAEYTVNSTTWYPNGLISAESVRSAKGDVITYSWHENGKPMRIQAVSPQNKPYGIHKTWDDQGRVIDYINYSVEWVDTLCYTAMNGKVQQLNLRDRSTTPLNWNQMPATYYGNEPKKYLYQKAAVYKVFHGNGKLKSEAHLKNGRLDGLYQEFDSTGAQLVQITYKMEVPDGAWTEWHPNGKVKRAYNYRNGLREGNCTEYYSTGSIKWENIYVNGAGGTPKAYAENGSLLASRTYLEAFYPQSCIDMQAANVRPAALHYYFLDTTLSNSSVTIPDSVLRGYVYKVIAMTNAVTPGYDMCGTVQQATPENGFDMYHSCFVLSKSLYNETNLQKIKAFFGRHGITMDKTEPSTNPVLGLEKEFLVYYSAKEMLNKQVIIDSLEAYLAPRAIDAKQGYILSVDNNVPEGGIPGVGSKAVITSDTGYSEVVVEAGARNPSYPASDTFHTTTYIIYDDLTCDVRSAVYTQPQMLFWAMK